MASVNGLGFNCMDKNLKGVFCIWRVEAIMFELACRSSSCECITIASLGTDGNTSKVRAE